MKSKIKPELLSALFPATVGAKSLTPELYCQELDKRGLSHSVKNGRLILSGGRDDERKRCINILHSNPDLEARLILREAVRDASLRECIEERACLRWVEGYSDSLYMAVLSGLTPTEETREYLEKPDEKQASFLRRMGIAEADIMNREKCPSVWVKQKPKTDCEAELQQYQ